MHRRLAGPRAALAAAVLALAAPGQLNAQLTAFTSQPLFSAAAGPTTVITFEGFAPGTQLTNQLAGSGIDAVSGVDAGPVGVFVGSSAALPFPMFNAGTLPSEPNFISNDMAGPTFATGEIFFDFLSAPKTAIGAFVADRSPLGGFTIEVFDGAVSLGSITVGPRTLPSSFVGVTSLTPFTRARFAAVDVGDSWGLDNLEFNRGITAVPEPGSWALVATGLLALGGAYRSRRRTR